MSLFPYNHPFFRSGNWWDSSTLGRLFDQDFGVGLLESDPFFRRSGSMMPYWMQPRSSPAVSTDMARGTSEVSDDPDTFAVNIDTSHFSPEEIKVKVVDNNLIVEGRHEEKMDQHGFVSRSFTRRYLLPKEVEVEQLASNLTPGGVLHIEAPKKGLPQKHERTIPVQFGAQRPAIQQQGASSASGERNVHVGRN